MQKTTFCYDTDEENLPTIDTLSPPVVKGTTKNTNKTNERKPTNNQRKPRTNKYLFIKYQTSEDIEQFSSQEEDTITSFQKKTPKQNDTNKKSPFASLTSTSTITTVASLPKIPKRKPASTASRPSTTAPKPTATTAKSTATAPKPTITTKPTTTTSKPTTTTPKPTITTFVSTTMASKPITTAPKTTATANEPTIATFNTNPNTPIITTPLVTKMTKDKAIDQYIKFSTKSCKIISTTEPHLMELNNGSQVTYILI
ncbi:uncharacterized protein [Clytia hemisphaerica]|uniref:uncharacterized protein n=1 Tax=Clytia hemisphaerica TaxID=252671 RepID=UPI0034D56EBA